MYALHQEFYFSLFYHFNVLPILPQKKPGALCHFHVHFHGCGMCYDNIGTEFILGSGFLDVAEANNIVMLFPQVRHNTIYVSSNHFGSK